MRILLLLATSVSVFGASYTASCPATTVTNQPILCNFSMVGGYFAGTETMTITPSGTGTITLDPSGTERGGVGWFPSIGQITYNFVFRADTTGVKTLHFTNSAGYTDPADVTVTVSSPGSPPTFPASLVPSLVQAVACPSDSSVTSWTCPITATAGNTLIVGVSLYNAASSTDWPTIVDNIGNHFTRDAQISYFYTTIFQNQAIYRLRVGPGVTSYTVTRSTASYSVAVAMEETNLDPNPLDVADNAGNDFHSGIQWVSGPLITTNNADLIVGFSVTADSGAVNPGAGSPYSLAANVHDVTGGLSGSLVYALTPTTVTQGTNPGYYLPVGALWSGGGWSGLALGVAYKAALAPTGGGQSLVLTPGSMSTSVAVPPLTQSQPTRVEFQIHNWTTPSTTTNIWDMNDVLQTAELLPASGNLRMFDKVDPAAPSVCDIPLTGITNGLVRFQKNPTSSAVNGVPPMTIAGEVWNWDSTVYLTCQQQITSITSGSWPSPGGGKFGDSFTTADLGFYRVYGTLVPLGSKPPVTADLANCATVCTDYSFNDSTISGMTIQDLSGNGHNVTWPTSPPTAPTPNQSPVALIKTFGAPFWSNQVSMRAGVSNQLDCGSSYSLAEASASVSCFWQLLSGPSDPVWSDHKAQQPTLNGLVFGDYLIQLQVTDVASDTATQSLDIGSVATDSNGIVVQANPQNSTLFGDMIAFGKNPWPYEDSLEITALNNRAPYIDAISPPPWINNLPGAVSFWPIYGSMPNQTTVVTDGGSTITVADATKLPGLTTLPTTPAIIIIAPPATPFGIIEEVRVCSASGNVLTVCYNGRGWRLGTFGEVTSVPTWPANSIVYQENVDQSGGTATTMQTTFCPAGPGEEGQIVYNTGTVAVVHGSNVIHLTGGTWDNSSTSPLNGARVRISGTHGGGTPFVFFAGILSIDTSSQITMGFTQAGTNYPVPWPSSADDATGLTYAIIAPGTPIALGWTRPDATHGLQNAFISSCESESHAYLFQPTNVANYVTTQQTGQNYSVGAVWLSASVFGVDYYDEVLANYAGYLRSGLTKFLTYARKLGDYWASQPGLDQGYIAPPGPGRSASMTGMVAAYTADPQPRDNFYTIRELANTISIPSTGEGGAIAAPCFLTDVREAAYGLSWIAHLSLFDPVPTNRSFYSGKLAQALTSRFNNCIYPSGEFPQYYEAPQISSSGLTATNGSTTVTGTGIAAAQCGNPVGPSPFWTGVIHVTNGSSAATGTGFVACPTSACFLVIQATYNSGTPKLFYSQYLYIDSTHVTLVGQNVTTNWQWDTSPTGGFNYQLITDQNYFSMYLNSTDPDNLNNFYACTNTSTTITLDRAWNGCAGGAGATCTVTGGRANWSEPGWGVGTQPFLNGINVWALWRSWAGATQAGDSATAAGFLSLAQQDASWILTTGFDQANKGMYYFRTNYSCEPMTVSRTGCSYANTPDGEASERTQNAEVGNAMVLAYKTNPTPANRIFADEFYGAQFGNPSFCTQPGVSCPYYDNVYVDIANLPGGYSRSWWVGFLFGMGMSHQWPAARLGGVAPANLVNRTVSCNLSAVTGATGVQLTITAPSGAVSKPAPCGSCPCAFQIDVRQGASNVSLDYVNGSTVLAHGTALPID